MKDAKGHGSNARNSAPTGDPSREVPDTRAVPGHGIAPRSQVVARHNYKHGVGTRSTSGGGGSSGGGGQSGGGGKSPARKPVKGQGTDVLPMQQVQSQQVQKQAAQFANTAKAKRAK